MLHVLARILDVLVVIPMALAAAAVIALDGAVWVRERWRRWRGRNRLVYERYAAEQFIGDTRRRAIREMLAAAHEVRRQVREDVIEGTAVEVKR